jgi:hypothetical protein
MNSDIDSPVQQSFFKLSNENPNTQGSQILAFVSVADGFYHHDFELHTGVDRFKGVDYVSGLGQGEFAPASADLNHRPWSCVVSAGHC